jgi:hypothetical protein
LGFDLAGSCGFALETADGETLLGDGVSDVGGVLPEGELDDAHDQDQQQRRGEYKLGRNRAALVTSHSATPPTPARWRAQPPQRHGVGQFPVLMLFAVVSTLEAMTATAPMASATNKAVMTTVSVE